MEPIDLEEPEPEEENNEPPMESVPETANSVVKSLRSTVLPILRKMWQDKGSSKSGKGAEGKGSTQKSTVRIAVISVMMHCLKHLPADDFASELPRILGYVVVGLKDRDSESRRASRQALQSVSLSLGPAWLPWIIRELRSRLNRGFMVPVRGAAVLSALQALTGDNSLKSGDLDSSLQELLTESMEELERQMASKEAETGEDTSMLRPGQVPEAKKPKGPDFMLLAGQFATAPKVLELIWALDRKLTGESLQADQSDMLPRGMVFLRKVEELMTRALSGLCLNSSFGFPEQVSAGSELLKVVQDLLSGKHQKRSSGEEVPAAKGLAVAKHRLQAFQVQEGAATGRSGRASGRQGVDDSARAGALGVLGLRLLRHTLQGSKKQDGDGGDGNALEEVVPAVVTCFSSRQDRLFVASAKCLGLLRGYFDSRPEVLGQYGASIAHTVLKTFEITASAPRLSQHLRAKAKTHGLAGVGAEAMLATSTRLLAALLNHRTSAEWFRAFGDEEAAPQQLKVVKEEKEKK